MKGTIEERNLIFRGNLIDGKGGYAEKATMEIYAGQITRLELRGDVPADSNCVNVGAMTIMPGLIDAHVHLWGPEPWIISTVLSSPKR